MKKNLIFLLGLLLIATLSCNNNTGGSENGKTMYTNAVIFTADVSNPNANTLVVEDERIAFAGTRAGAEKLLQGEDVKVVDMEGKMIVPGFVESHMHPVMGALMTLDFNIISSDASLKEILAQIAEADRAHPDAERLLFQGYSMAHLSSLPTAKDIDALVSGKPVMLFDEGFHSAWVNTKCLEEAGITKQTPDPIPGLQYFVRDAEGNPTGYMMDLLPWMQVVKSLGILNEDSIVKGIGELLENLHAYGFTALFDAGAAPDPVAQFNAITRLDNENRLNLHYCGSYYVNPAHGVAESVGVLKELHNRYNTGNVHVNTLKLILDGTVEARTAATVIPFEGETECADMFIGENKFFDLFYAALSAGFNTHVHAIGDRSVSTAIDVYTRLSGFGFPGTKTICHNQMYPADGVERIGKLKDLFFQTTPSWLEKDDYTAKTLGTDRVALMFPTNSVRKKGLTVTFGCDYPASPMDMLNPMVQIYYAVLRGEANDLLFPSGEEGIGVEEAIKAYTINGARQLGISDITGSITAGKLADFVVLDKDIRLISTDGIKNTRVLKTYFRGRCVYESN